MENLRFVRKKGKKKTPIDLVENTGKQDYWIRQTYGKALGMNKREADRPMIKVLVACGATRLGDFPDHLDSEMGGVRYAAIQKRTYLNCVNEEDLAKFLAAWLSR